MVFNELSPWLRILLSEKENTTSIDTVAAIAATTEEVLWSRVQELAGLLLLHPAPTSFKSISKPRHVSRNNVHESSTAY
jgi:hypothetical protein